MFFFRDSSLFILVELGLHFFSSKGQAYRNAKLNGTFSPNSSSSCIVFTGPEAKAVSPIKRLIKMYYKLS